MACRAGGRAIAADLHVPEQRFAQRNRRLAVPDELAKIGRFGDQNGLE